MSIQEASGGVGTMDLTDTFAFSGSSLAFGVASGLVPILNTEAYLLAAAALAPPEALAAVIGFTTLGQMIAKTVLYWAGAGAVSQRLLGRHAPRLCQVKERIARARAGAWSLVFASAVTGCPPFYLVSVAAGALRYSLALFLVIGGLGRLLRFAAVVAAPRLIGAMP